MPTQQSEHRSRGDERHPRKLTSRKRLLFKSIILFLAFLVFETLSAGALVFLHGSLSQVAKKLRHVSQTDAAAAPSGFQLPVVLHPYIGSVLPSQRVSHTSQSEGRFRVTEFGFVDVGPPLYKRSDEHVIVVILGGSVARQFAQNATRLLERQLSQLPKYSDRSFKFVRAAVDGFKQPQQLMVLNYLMALGGQFDIVINLDGVNEAALPAMDNVPFGVSAAYPRKWNRLVASVSSIEQRRLIGHIMHLRYLQRESATSFGSPPLKYSFTARLIWSAMYERRNNLIMANLNRLNQIKDVELTYCAFGPPESFESDSDLFDHCVDLWARSSILCHKICQAHGAQYFHFLQPNQYVPDSKPMGPAEERVAINFKSPFRVPVIECYPRMQSRTRQLTDAGVHFSDLTEVFADEHRPIYQDDCCHVNSDGDMIIGRAIAQSLVAALRDKKE